MQTIKATISGYTQYRGDGQYVFLLHRIGGIGLFVLFTTYILALVGVRFIHTLYENWLFQVIILFCAIFHAINGLRITIFDLFPNLIPHRRPVMWVQWLLFLAIYGFAMFVVVRNAFGG
jgi:succinate dehydrogenase / fumarate reductase, cytochrome b subunit